MRYPPGRTAPAHAAISANALARAEDYAELRQWGESREAAAMRLGVTLRSTYRYEARLRRGAGSRQEAA